MYYCVFINNQTECDLVQKGHSCRDFETLVEAENEITRLENLFADYFNEQYKKTVDENDNRNHAFSSYVKKRNDFYMVGGERVENNRRVEINNLFGTASAYIREIEFNNN